MEFLCIYHGNCADGFGSAWVVRKALKLRDDQLFAATHGDAPPDVTDKVVIIVDFSYKRPVLEQMAKDAQAILILDHHKSALEDLEGYPEPTQSKWVPLSGVYALFDMERSGAGICWDYFYPNTPRPQLINHIEDRDLWRFQLEGTREIQAAIFSHPYDFGVWDRLMELPVEPLQEEGKAIERKHHKDVAELVNVTQRTMVLGGYAVPVANLPYTIASDAGHMMADDAPFAACYWDTPDGRVFSLRSVAAGVDVSKIAVGYGGGGHKNAAGFRMPIGWEGDEQ